MMITLPPICDRAAAAALYPELTEAQGAAPVAINASKVERMGQAMLQVLVAAAGSEGGITIHQPSPAFAAALRLAGLDSVVLETITP